MMNSIVTNVIPSNVPSSRKGIRPFGQGEPVAVNTQAKVQPQPVAVQDSKTAQTAAVPAKNDTFVKQPKV